jgi:protein arginine kinase activator
MKYVYYELTAGCFHKSIPSETINANGISTRIFSTMNMCEECGVRPANIHLTQIVENETQSFHLCEECARKRGINISIEEQNISLSAVSPEPVEKVEQEPDRECPVCRMKLSEFRSKGRLGCPDCYRAFEEEIGALLLQSHGSTLHKGKMYRKSALDKQEKTDVSQLRSELNIAIKNEEFERAAQLA